MDPCTKYRTEERCGHAWRTSSRFNRDSDWEGLCDQAAVQGLGFDPSFPHIRDSQLLLLPNE